MKVVINTSSFGKFDASPLNELKKEDVEFSLNPYKRQLTQEEVIDLSKEAVGIIAGTEPLNTHVLNQLSRLKVISRCGSGLDNVDLKAAQEKGIKVFSTPLGPTIAVAELALGLVLSLLRKTHIMNDQLKSGKWEKVMGNLLFGKNVGIVGYGRIGQEVAKRLKAFGCHMAYFDIKGEMAEVEGQYLPLEELLAWADIICLHVSKSQQDGFLITEKEIKIMKEGSWLVNCSRGGVVDEEALYRALKSGRLSGAAVDVFEKEPYTGSLRNLDNVLLTPHIGSYAKEARIQMEKEAVHNLLKSLRGEL